ncbi:inhibitor of apoptosis-promoting Bax1-domain-containing protein [Chytriomyces sp. MP71]|nr:inhibitor of apoptosis-promoting Bax1-domain-containing protein [Chytriomyces sp. MP71]
MSNDYRPILSGTAVPPPPAYNARDAEHVPLLGEAKPFVSECPVHERLNFARKVYSILAAQIGLTAILSALFLYNADIRHVVQRNAWSVLLSSLSAFGLLFALFAYRSVTPTNKILLFAFTLAEAYSVAVVCSFYESESVLQATILTFAVFIALTLFTLQSKMSFEGMGPFLFGSLTVVVFAGFLELFFPFSRLVDLVIATVSAVLFCGYIVYDTYMIFVRCTVDDVVIASVELYLDVINLFLSILRILGSARDD